MNVLIVAVCVNIAVVSANKEYVTNKILKILLGKRAINTDTAETNESVEAIPLIPGFYLEKPKELSKSLFRYRIGKHDAVYSSSKNKGASRHDEKEEPIANSATDATKLLVYKLLTKISNEIKSSNDYPESENYRNEKPKKSNSNISPEYAKKVLVEQLLQVLTGIKNRKILKHRYDIAEDRSWNTGSNKKENLEKILNAVQNTKQYKGTNKRPISSIIALKTNPSLLSKSSIAANIEDLLNGRQQSSSSLLNDDLENNASEVLDDDDDDSDESSDLDFPQRRHTRRRIGSTSNESDNKKSCDSDEKTEEVGSSSEREKNPGNPYTIHRNRYKQNWPWNHNMDGDHMNVNPLGPKFPDGGPTGPQLFFGRKWWYFNQDDYKPMG